MARKTRRPKAPSDVTLTARGTACPSGGHKPTVDYSNRRVLTTLQGVTRFRLQIRRCHRTACACFLKPRDASA